MNVKIGNGKVVHQTVTSISADSRWEQTMCGKTLEKAVEVEAQPNCKICSGWSSR
jgi:hypothetical protein